MRWELFSRKQKGDQPVGPWTHLQVKSRLWGLRISGWLGRRTQRFSAGQIKRYCMLFILIGACWNTWIIVQALRQPHPPVRVRSLQLSDSILPSIRPAADPSSLESIRNFRSWLDSLRADTAGRRIYDSIQRQRPGLLDSLRLIERHIPFNIKN